MEITIKKAGERDGRERFILVDPQSREVLTAGAVSEAALRRFFDQHGFDLAVVDQSLDRARSRFVAAQQAGPTGGDGESGDESDLLFELGLGDDDDAH